MCIYSECFCVCYSMLFSIFWWENWECQHIYVHWWCVWECEHISECEWESLHMWLLVSVCGGVLECLSEAKCWVLLLVTTTPGSAVGWGRVAGKWPGAGDAGWQLYEHELAVCPGCQEGQWHKWCNLDSFSMTCRNLTCFHSVQQLHLGRTNQLEDPVILTNQMSSAKFVSQCLNVPVHISNSL